MPKGRVGIEQFEWLHALEGIEYADEKPFEVYIWRPDDWDAIIAVATGR
jgi:hypothetical protein